MYIFGGENKGMVTSIVLRKTKSSLLVLDAIGIFGGIQGTLHLLCTNYLVTVHSKRAAQFYYVHTVEPRF